ncbi:MAG: phytoene desaturase family protein [Actinomycetota bacterium]
MSSYDIVVVGAGHNGLVCAAYLARAGLSVVVLERSDRIGGACVTEELFEGFRMSSAAYSLSLLRPEVIDDLELELDVRFADPAVFAPMDNGPGLLLWRDSAARHRAIGEVFGADADAYDDFCALFGEAAAQLRPLFSYPATRRHVRRAFKKSAFDDLFAKTIDGSIADVCEEYFESDVMKGIMASQGILGSTAGPRTPGTAYIFLHHFLGTFTGAPGEWALVRGGMGMVTEQLAEAVRRAGGEIRLEAEVAGLKLDGRRRASGVVLTGGEEIDARAVCSNADPHRTVALFPRGSLPADFVADVELLSTPGATLKVNCALSGLPAFTHMSGNATGPGPEHLGAITVAPSIEYLEKACLDAAAGRPASDMFCEAWIQSAGEDGLAPRGKHTLSVFAQYAPYELAEGTWDERREEIGNLVIGTLERYAPGLSDLIEDRIVFGPVDLESRFGLTGGNIFHGELLPDWLFERRPAPGWHRNRLPVAGAYLCGSGAHPGGGVTGAPGRLAARAVLEDLVAAG